MTSLLARAAGFFVAPAKPATFAPPRPRAAVAGVLADEAVLMIAAGSVAAALRRDVRAATALICAWRGHDEPPLPAPAPRARSAARVASKLARRGLAARACGAMCVVELPADAEAATAAFSDAAAAAEAPVVLTLARRDPAMDALLAEADRLVLALAEDADPALAELAVAALGALGPPTERITLPSGLLARQAARLGLAASAAPVPAPRDTPAGALQGRPS